MNPTALRASPIAVTETGTGTAIVFRMDSPRSSRMNRSRVPAATR